MNGTVYDAHAAPLEKILGAARIRHQLLSLARGPTLEINSGTGFNFEHYPPGIQLTAEEADPGMRAIGTRRARQHLNIEVGSADAQSLPHADESFETVVATFTLCSADDPVAVLREAYRVLKPGGRMLLLEHVYKDTVLAGPLLQLANLGWKQVSGGCQLTRHPESWPGQVRFEVEKHETIWAGYGGTWVLNKPAS
jgi:ubiquinone/menaquinone biosynthesis C-methylase UbiE